jgi:predicted RNase H-like HicB family nuclease
MKASDRYLKIVEWSEEDQCYVGTCPGLMLGGIHGDDETEVYRELCQAVEEWIDVYRQDGEPLPEATAGKVRHGGSLNEHCVHLLREERLHYGASKAADSSQK